MQYQEFLNRVNRTIEGGVTADAERATAATLATLGERITKGEAEDLASQLPAEIKDQLSAAQSEQAEGFSLSEFYRRVADREDRDVKEATYHAQAVMKVVGQAATGGELDDIKEQLPREFEPLFA